jgi:hypothetical protein
VSAGRVSDASAGFTAFSIQPGLGGLLDGAGTPEADPTNTFSYRLNLTKCLEAAEPTGISFNVNQTRSFAFQASSLPADATLTGLDTASQIIFFRRTE